MIDDHDPMFPYEVVGADHRRRGKFTSFSDAKDFARLMILISDGRAVVDVVGPDPDTDLSTIRTWRIRAVTKDPANAETRTEKVAI